LVYAGCDPIVAGLIRSRAPAAARVLSILALPITLAVLFVSMLRIHSGQAPRCSRHASSCRIRTLLLFNTSAVSPPPQAEC
jgi:hypothetical protein